MDNEIKKPIEQASSFNFFQTPFKKGDCYKLIFCELKHDKKRRIAKVFDKKSLMSLKNHLEQVKVEIIVHLKLIRSNCILKLDYVVETKNEICLIYEPSDSINLNLSKEIMSLQFLKKILIETTIGLSEINSYGYVLTNFGKENIASSIDGSYKIFDLNCLCKLGLKINSSHQDRSDS